MACAAALACIEAIEEENYELATKLRDEIKRREEESN